ncbi:expansin B [Aphelenchoides avenae]|nr:expansin B [Aphelenchus avenae]
MAFLAFLSVASSVFVAAVNAQGFTYYNDAGYGACGGQINAASEMLAAVNSAEWAGGNPEKDPLCKKCVKVSYKGKT